MKINRLIAFLLVFIMCFALAACQNSDDKENTSTTDKKQETEQIADFVVATRTTGDDKTENLSVAEYNYYYMGLYNQIVGYTQQIEAYYGAGQGSAVTGFSLTEAPAEQEYVGADAPEGVETWADYFRIMAPVKAFMNRQLYKDATSEKSKKEGFELSEQQKNEMKTAIDTAVESMAENAEEIDYKLDEYIAKTCGEGLTEKSYREFLERDFIVQYYVEWYEGHLSETIEKSDIEEYYNAHKSDFDYADVRLFKISYKPDSEEGYTEAQAKKRAEEFAGKVTDDASFEELAKEYAVPSQKESYSVSGATLAENIQKSQLEGQAKTVAEWIFDGARKKGDVKAIHEADAQCYYVAYIVSPAARDTQTAGADVRHLLVKAEGDKDFTEAKKEAENILKEWKAGSATEESFAALVKEKTDDLGSKEIGGLYEDINSTSNYVPEFRDWAIASHKVGDTGIVKTDYGYHIMYFVGADKTQKWESDVKEAASNALYNEFTDTLYDSILNSIQRNEKKIDKAAKALEDLIANGINSFADNSNSDGN